MEQIAARIGLTQTSSSVDTRLLTYINLKLSSIGCPILETSDQDPEFRNFSESLLANNREKSRLLADYLCPSDWRIQKFLDDYLYPVGKIPRLPTQTFVLDRYGLARAMSLPHGGDKYVSDIVSSYRVNQGVLHNPANDRRTTQGVFHVAEGGLPIPNDKKAVPLVTFGRMLGHALQPPSQLLKLPFTSGRSEEAECFVSLLLRPLVCPAVPGFTPAKSMEIRFFAPGNLVSNLDFVESIFGNAGDPFLPQNDAGLDPENWSGHTGCVILAPHLTRITKVAVGLPSWEFASERQRRDGMCWKTEDELYNDGGAFKLTARNQSGTIVTIIADNYFGYCKKEVKTQISFAANLYGRAEEEHAGGALVFPSYDLGEEFDGNLHVKNRGHSFEEVVSKFGEIMEIHPEGYGIDKRYPNVIYVPEDVNVNLQSLIMKWKQPDGSTRSLKLLADKIYIRPSGYRLRIEKSATSKVWRLIGVRADPTFCHKPCTVSGGGKSEISKPISDAIIQGPVFVADFKTDCETVEELLAKDYSERFLDPALHGSDQRPILSPERSLGSVIKLLTPAVREYSEQYNTWLMTIPQHVKEILFVVKRFYEPSWNGDWRKYFSVDMVNGIPGNALKFKNNPVLADYLRVGFEADGAWRVFSLRKDFYPAAKLQLEDDITASVTVPVSALQNPPSDVCGESVKFAENTEYRLFQRPDDAIHPGYDKQTESDFSQPGNFFSNYEPLEKQALQNLYEDAIEFSKFTPPMQNAIRNALKDPKASPYFVCSAVPRLVDGKPSKNPRYLQVRQDLVEPRDAYLAEITQRLYRRIPLSEPMHSPITAILPGRRNNPAEKGVRPLAVFNPIHHLELPELFLEFICSLTGKSPSTTGAGSEGALTKGPFNALPPIIDLNAALVSYLITAQPVFVTAAGYVGPNARVDHDVSLLIPEVWSRMTSEERKPEFLIKNGCLDRVPDMEFEGRILPSSRLGWRINRRFVRMFFGRIFNYPHMVFTPEMLEPEKQDLAQFADAMDNIVETQRQVAESYFADGGIDMACPPLRALLHIMRDGHFENKTLLDPGIRALFDPAIALASDWYQERLESTADHDRKLWHRHVKNLETFSRRAHNAEVCVRLNMDARLDLAHSMLRRVIAPDYVQSLHGTIGRIPLPGE